MLKSRMIPKKWCRVLLLISIISMATEMVVVDVVAFQPNLSESTSLSRILLKPEPNRSSMAPNTFIRGSKIPLQQKEQNGDNNDLTLTQNQKDPHGNLDEVCKERIDGKVDDLLALLDTVPSNLPTPKSLTEKILFTVKSLEESCPTLEDSVLTELSGNWELLWTAQDQSSEQYVKGGLANRFINPLENQSYSNNPFRGRNALLGTNKENEDDAPSGRANPILPREIQDVLERTGILEASGGTKVAPIRSSQGIDIKRKRVRNVVNVQVKRPFPIKGSLVVDVNFQPNDFDKRKIDVKFDSCRVVFQNANIDQKFPLGVLGPTGWLRTGFIDDRIRITRGHKGSVFILSRTSKRTKKKATP